MSKSILKPGGPLLKWVPVLWWFYNILHTRLCVRRWFHAHSARNPANRAGFASKRDQERVQQLLHAERTRNESFAQNPHKTPNRNRKKEKLMSRTADVFPWFNRTKKNDALRGTYREDQRSTKRYMTRHLKYMKRHMSYGQNLVHGEGTSLSRVGPYRFCSGGALDKPYWGYRFRVGPYRFCTDGNPTTLSILLWSYLILSDTHMRKHLKKQLKRHTHKRNTHTHMYTHQQGHTHTHTHTHKGSAPNPASAPGLPPQNHIWRETWPAPNLILF